jgi:hypothetical protein
MILKQVHTIIIILDFILMMKDGKDAWIVILHFAEIIQIFQSISIENS